MPAYDNINDAYDCIVDGAWHTVSLDTTGATEETNENTYVYGYPTVWMKIDLSALTDGTPVEVRMNAVKTGGDAGFEPYGDGYKPEDASFDPATPDFSLITYISDWFIGDGTSDPPENVFTLKGGAIPTPADDESATGIFYMPMLDWNFAYEGTVDVAYKITVPTLVTGNDDFVDAYELTGDSGSLLGDNTGATSDGADDPLDTEFGFGDKTVWFKVESSGSWRSIILTLDQGTNTFPILGVYTGTTLADLISVLEYEYYNNTPITLTIPAGIDYYIEVTGLNNSYQGTFSLLYEFGVVTTPPSPDGPAQGIEIKSPSAPFTLYPGGAIAVRVSDYMGAARGTLDTDTDTDSPTGDYVVDTQIVTGITAGSGSYYGSSIHSTADVTIDIDFDAIEVVPSVKYAVFVAYKAVGTTPDGVPKTGERFHVKTCARIYYEFNDSGFFSYGGDLANYSEHQWRYEWVGDHVRETYEDDWHLRLKAFSINDVGVEVRIAQVVLIPRGIQGTHPEGHVDEDFDSWNYLYNYTYGPDAIGGALGDLTIDSPVSNPGAGGEWLFGGQLSPQWVDYQDGSDEYAITDFTPTEWLYNYISRLWIHVGTIWYPLIELIDETFTRTLPPVAGAHFFDTSHPTYDANWAYGFGVTDYNYVWFAYALWGDMSHDWGYNGFYGPEQESWIEVDGSEAKIVCGGYDTGLMGIRAVIAGAPGITTALDGSSAPILTDLQDYVIEGSFRMDGALDSTGVAEIGKIGKMENNGDGSICVIVEWQPDGSLEIRLDVQSTKVPNTGSTTYPGLVGDDSTYQVDGPIVFDAGVYDGSKINLKLCRQRYVVKAKVWYDGDTEPSSWTLEGFLPGIRAADGDYSSGPYEFFAYPYAEESGYVIVTTGFENTLYDDGGPYFASRVALEQIVPSNNGGQYTRVTFSWDDFKVTYDPDGDAEDTHFMIGNEDDETIWTTDTTVPKERHGFYYCGKRLWGQDGGQQIYTWVDSGAGKLIGSFASVAWWRRLVNEAAGAIASLWWREGQK